MRRLAVGFGLLVAAAAIAATLLATVASGRSSAGTTIHLIEKSQAFHLVDNPPIGVESTGVFSLGDTFALKSALLTRSMKPAGTLFATCTVTSGGRNAISTCYGTFALKGGQLAGITTIRVNGRVTRIAIVGGTGAYEGVRGEVTSISRGQNSPFSDDTIHLLP